MKIYTKKGDDGSTGLLYGGRVRKDDTGPEAYGTLDEAVAALGVARAIATESSAPIAAEILELQRRCFVAGAELATAAENLHKLEEGMSKVPASFAADLEPMIDALVETHGMPTEFVVPGGNELAAAIDVARTIVRRAERRSVAHMAENGIEGSQVVPFLNRLADYLWMAARACEDTWMPTRERPTSEEDESE